MKSGRPFEPIAFEREITPKDCHAVPASIEPDASALHHQADVRCEFTHAVFFGVPRTHEARAAIADEGVEAPAPGRQGCDGRLRQLQKHAIGLHREHQFDAGNVLDQISQQLRAPVGVASMFEPRVVFQQATQGADRKRIFDANCPACLQR